MSRIFISYKRVDKDKVFKIKDQIESALGEKCWIDLDGIESDAQFANVIINAINNCEVFLFMYSSAHSKITDYKNDWTIRELYFAQHKKKRIVIVNIDGSKLTNWFGLLFGAEHQIDGKSGIALIKLCEDISKWLKTNNSIQGTEIFKGFKLHICSNCGAPLCYYGERCPCCNAEQGILKNVSQQNTQRAKPVFNSQGYSPEQNSHKATTEKSIHESNPSLQKSKCHFVFLSHSSDDKETIQKVYDMLSQSPYRPWMAPQDIVPGKPYAKSIIEGIKECPIFLIFVSSSAMNSDNVLSEVEKAHKERKIILPIFIEDVKLNDELEYYLARKQWIKATGEIEDCYTIIIDSIKENLKQSCP